jgi:hypothetical protein
MVRETEEAFEKIVVPYIESFDESRLDWYASHSVRTAHSQTKHTDTSGYMLSSQERKKLNGSYSEMKTPMMGSSFSLISNGIRQPSRP